MNNAHPDAQRAFEEMMPEPFGYVPFPGEFYKSEELDAEVKADPMVPAVYSRAQLRTAMQAVWDAATERAAILCEVVAGRASFVNNLGAQLAAEQCADEIRGTT